jgi:hypothetical protein
VRAGELGVLPRTGVVVVGVSWVDGGSTEKQPRRYRRAHPRSARPAERGFKVRHRP